MSANICNICGANLIYKDGKWVCPACGAYKTEEISNEEVTLLYNAAQKLRLASFDDAEEDYRDIIAKYPENSEAHWGLVLSKYGIKYEDDYDGKKLPTCYATSIESILTDKDYLDAVRLCKDKHQKEYYIEQGKVLEKIRVEWLEKASKEPKYDVFLCFKDSDKLNNMERTDDSIEVANLYTHLSSLGYKVFYSRESLRDKVAEKYEPYIYNALNTTAVMIVYGSKTEYFSSVWMKNEWTRYVRRLREGLKIEGSLLIACDGVNPADLPKPLNQMQVLDARKKTFYGDLEKQIAKVVSVARRPKATVERVEISSAIGKKKASIDNQIKTIKISGDVSKKTQVVIDNAVSVREIGRYDVPTLTPDEDTKLKSINLFLQKELFDNAKKIVDEILKKNKYNGQALLADLLIKYKSKNIDELSDKIEEIDDISQFSTVIEYNDKDIGEKLITVIIKKIRLAVANSNYDTAIAYLKEIVVYNSADVLNIRLDIRKTATRLLSVSANTSAEIFDVLLNSYQDSETYIEYIQAFVDDCIKNRQFAIAQKYNDKVVELDDGDLKATFSQAYIYVQATSFDEFAAIADRFVDFKLFDNAINHFDKNEITECFNRFRKIIFGLITNQKSGDAIAEWFDFIIKYEFDGRDEFIEVVINSLSVIKDLTERAKLFDRAIMCIDGSDVERHISMRLSFAKKLQTATNFALASKYYKEILDIEEGNLEALWGIILCNLKALRETDIAEQVEKFNCFKEFETLLKYCPDMGIRAEYLDKIVNAVLFKSASLCNEELINKLANVFDGIIKYYPEECNEILVKHLQKFADNCKNSSAFSLAEKYYAMVLAIDNMKHEAYWGLLQAKLNCRNNDDLIKQKKNISEFSEFSSAIAAASNDERSADKYASIAKNQIDYQENLRKKEFAKKKRRKKIGIFSSIAAVVLVIAIAAVGVFQYIKVEKNFKFAENESGYTIDIGKYYKEGNVEIPATYNGKPVTKIADGMFENDTNITTITLSSNITYIGSNAFKNCTNLKQIIFKSAKTYTSYSVKKLTAVKYATSTKKIDSNNNVAYIGVDAFYNCTSLESIDLSSATLIGENAFYGCSKLESVNLSDNLTKLSKNTFSGCLKLNNLQMPASLTEIEANCFVNCQSLSSITIPATTTTVGANVFNGCTNLNRIVLEERQGDLSGFDEEWNAGVPSTTELKVGFKISLDYNGATSGNETTTSIVSVGESYTLPVPERVGYRFVGWYDGIKNANKLTDENGNSVGAYEKYESISAYAIWEANLNEIVFNANGGEGEMDNQKVATDATATLNECLYTKKGYTFAGWGTTANGEVNYSDKADYMMGTNAQYVLYAIWTPNNNLLHFESNGGSGKMSDMTIATDSKATLSANAFTKTGYDFLGWSETLNGSKVYSDCDSYIMGIESATLYALWTPKSYKITYNLNDGQLAVENKATYNIETATFTLNNPTKRGYEFKGWSGSNLTGNDNQVVSIEMGTYGELTFTANWTAIEYDITYNLNEGANSSANPKTYTIEQEVRLQDPERKGYKFSGWTDNGLISKGSIGEKTFTANWEIVNYSITYNLENGTNNSANPKNYNVNTPTITLKAPTKLGYKFIEWSNGGVIESGSVGVKFFTAKWEIETYTINYELNGGTNNKNNPDTYTVHDNITLAEPTRKGYTFVGWSNNGKIAVNSIGDKSFTASWQIIDYKITYVLNGGTNSKSNKDYYNVESDEITLEAPTRAGYTFIGWSNNGKIPAHSIGSKEFVASWTANQNTLKFNANGGNDGEMSDVILSTDEKYNLPENTLTRTGYNFIGWSTTANGKVEFADESVYTMGIEPEATLYAIWSPITYSITYELNDGKAENVIEYCIETSDFSLNTPARLGYTFTGWTGTDLTEKTLEVSIAKGSYGNRNYIANWQANKNKVIFDPNGGDGSMPAQEIFTDATEKLTKNTFTAYGCNFLGWATSADGSIVYNDEASYAMGTDSSYILYAVWDVITYNIAYSLNGGLVSGNISKYNALTSTFTLSNPTRDGYTFTGWTGTDLTEKALEVTIAKGSIGDRQYQANWEANTNTITFNSNGGSGVMDQQKINTDSAAVLLPNAFTKAGYTFIGWAKTANGSVVYDNNASYTMGTANNYNLYAKWRPNSNTLILDGNTSTSGSMSSLTIDTDVCIVLPTNAYKKQGYAFIGWAETANGNVVYADCANYTMGVEPTATLYAVWKANEYTISKNPQNDSSVTTQKVTYDELYTLSVPTRVGYTFDGWFTEVGGNGTKLTDADGNSIEKWTVADNITVYAKWLGTEGLVYTSNGDEYILSGVSNKTITEAYIPEYYNGKLVTAIGENAFNGCDKLTAVFMENTIETIGKGAFSGCSALTHLVVPFVGESRTATQEKGLLTYWFGQDSAENTEEVYQYYLDADGFDQTYSAYVPLSLASIKLTNAAKIPYGAFSYMSMLQEVSFIGASEIEGRAFEYATSIAAFNLTDTLVSIGINAFAHTGVKDIVIPTSVQSVGEGVFAGCKSLTKIEIPFVGENDSATGYNASIGWLFGQNSYDGMVAVSQNSWTTYISGVLKTVEITSASKIPDYAFANIKTLKNIVLADSINTIGNSAFSGCTDLFSINLEQITSFNSFAFYNDSKLTEIDFSNNLADIGAYAFYGTKLGKIEIPNSIVSIGSSAFASNSSLRTIIIRKEGSILSYSSDMLKGFNSYAKIYVPDGLLTSYKNNSSWKALGTDKFYGVSIVRTNGTAISGNTLVQYFGTNESVTIPSSVSTILSYAFYNNSYVKSVVVPGTITIISDYAFCGCDNLETVKLMRGTTKISSYAFAENALLKSINLPNTLTSIGSYAFYGCSGITELELPNGLLTIGEYAFRNMQLTTIVVPNSVTGIGLGAFQGCPLESITLPFVGTSRTISSSCPSTNDYTSVSSGTTLFGYIFGEETYYAYSSSSTPESTDTLIYQGQSYYKSGSKYYWSRYYIPSKLKTVVITDATGISANAFYGCTMIESLTLNEGITTIYGNAFYNCTSLKSMTLPTSVTELGSNAFYGCSSLTSVTLPNLTKISDYTFYNCSSLDGVVLPETLTTISSSAFRDCTSLTAIAIPSSVTSIGSCAFYGCSGITELELPNGLLTIGDYAFNDCINLSNIELPNTLTSIGSYAFYNCTSLYVMEIPRSVISIGSNSFSYCSNLRVFIIHNDDVSNLTTLGAGITKVFSGSTGKNLVVIVPADAYQAYKSASNWSEKSSLIYSNDYIVDNNALVVDGTLLQYWGNEKSYTVPDNVTTIGSYAFYGSALEELNYGTILEQIQDCAFANCTNLARINSTENGVFNLNGSLKKIGTKSFYNDGTATKIIVGKSVETIELGAFNGCNSLVSIELPFIGIDRGSTYSQSQVFGYIFGYETSNKEGTTMQYANYYYYIPASLREVVITDETVISQSAFINCSMIENIIIKSNPTSIGDYAFYNCDGLKTITIESNTMPTISTYVFNGDSTVVIKVNSAILSDYQSDENWSKRTLEVIQ